jgi:DNA-binding LacI/PurR family transcriptional regulator
MVESDTFNARALRGMLAERRITGRRFAALAGLSSAYVSHVLTGHKQPGELARIKIERAIVKLGLDREPSHAA